MKINNIKKIMAALLAMCSIVGFICYFASDVVYILPHDLLKLALIEMIVVSIALFLIYKYVNSMINRIICFTVVFILENYLHRSLLPCVVSLLYILLIILAFVLLYALIEKKPIKIKEKINYIINDINENLEKKKIVSISIIIFLIIFVIQAGRVNITIDYDSYWYILRAPYTTFNGNFYNANGLLNSVYHYPKGFEFLFYPLLLLNCKFGTYGFLTYVNIWIILLICIYVGKVTFKLSSNYKSSILAMNLVLFVPSIVNMGVSAKQDVITLLIQLIMFNAFLDKDIILAIACYLLSLCFKPTALIFSSIIFVICLIKYFIQKERIVFKKLSTIYLILATIFFVFITFRTIIVTGIPMTAIFATIWTKIGFKLNWPFSFSSIPVSAASMTAVDSIFYVIKRIFLLIFMPLGEDMTHVRIAWCGVIVGIILIVITLADKKEKDKYKILSILNLVLFFFVIVSLYMLWQIDGNYYLLFYTFLIIYGCCLYDGSEYKVPNFLKIIISIISIMLILCSNWACEYGFSKIDLLNKGFYANDYFNEKKIKEENKQDIYDKLNEDKNTRAIVHCSYPERFLFKCNVELYTDISTSGGNPNLVNDLDSFKKFLVWKDCRYFVADFDYISKEKYIKGKELIKDLISGGFVKSYDLVGNTFYIEFDRKTLEEAGNNEINNIKAQNKIATEKLVKLLEE